ncbi:hypothetical protein [Tenacibaculum agarivorans]|uniref:hypothetical protein n=1 Tax=Tenacibaculum agarivorans TaxID=1908389 RepID=UPI00094B97D4|nr:hypothetical protein [Tenacibaculum agarivorans]
MKSNIKKYFGEGLLIVFSVLFALFINKSFENRQVNQKKKIAKESILIELYTNQSILRNWKEKHTAIKNRITHVIDGQADSIKTELTKYDYLNLGVLTNNEPLINAILTNTAWESAKTTGIITEFDYETIQKLTHVYTMQEVLAERTIMNILDYYFDTASHDMNNLNKVLTQFQLRFWELTGQEELMITLYKDAIQQIEK